MVEKEKDIVERLRSTRCETNECWRERCDAADEIERLRADLAKGTGVVRCSCSNDTDFLGALLAFKDYPTATK